LFKKDSKFFSFSKKNFESFLNKKEKKFTPAFFALRFLLCVVSKKKRKVKKVQI
jgi:preprotein translocase subunit SecG